MNTYEVDAYVEYLHWMKAFGDAGFFTADLLNNPTPMQEAFFAGESAVFVSGSVGWVNWINGEFKANNPQPEAEIYVFDKGRAENVLIDVGSAMSTGLSIPARSADMIPDVLRFVELLYTDQELHHLWRYGVLGIDYEIVDGGRVLNLDEEGRDMPSGYYIPYENHRFVRENMGDWPSFHAFRDFLEDRRFVNPFADFVFDATVSPRMEAIMANIGDINGDLALIYLGLVDDMDEALADLTRRHIAAGLEEYKVELLRQLNQFIIDNNLNVTVR
jgi:putative aldouronate transport system substrate-binding protein